MKAVVVEHRGEMGSLKEVPVPRPGSHEILVRVTVAGVNPIDWKSRGRGDRSLPFVLGQDFAGVVSETGDGVTKYREGSVFLESHASTGPTPSSRCSPRTIMRSRSQRFPAASAMPTLRHCRQPA